jgi:hypothetical protein
LLEHGEINLHLEPHFNVKRVFDANGFRFGDLDGAAAVQQASREQFFNYIVLGGGPPGAHTAPRPEWLGAVRESYEKVGEFRDDLGATLELLGPAVPRKDVPMIEIAAPSSGEAVRANGIETTLRGRVLNAQPGWRLLADIYTNRWYPQGEAFSPKADGSFAHPIYLGSPCGHFIRVRLFDAEGNFRATASRYGVKRANPDGSAPDCP